jgi:LPXTG-site transpeptidase (sortase) family protein
LVLGTLAGSALALALGLYFIPESLFARRSAESGPRPFTAGASAFNKVNIGRPVRLKIPGIKVDAAVEHVGVTPQGDMGVPSTINNTSWYRLGPSPGEAGSAVIAGHFDGKKGEPGVFHSLDTLTPGDKLYVTGEKGETITFVVRESRRYNPDADAAEVFNSSDGKAHLNLITCEGVWNDLENSYSHRLVVFTDQEI